MKRKASSGKATAEIGEERKDIFQQITEKIIAAIEAGKLDYKMPWHKKGTDSVIPVNATTKKAYRGVNVLMLWATAEEKGYGTNVWATYRQWAELGAQVRMGEKATHVCFWKFRKEEDAAGSKDDTAAGETTKSRSIPLARSYAVFNAAQVDNWAGNDIKPEPETEAEAVARIEHADEFFQATGAEIREGGNLAYYRQSSDHIQMPPFKQFKKADYYYSVLSHESIHWTGGNPNRTPRDMGKRFGSEAYAMEELVAELGAAFLSAELNLDLDPRVDHAPYVQNWLTVLKSDKRAIVAAASKAQSAVDFLLRKQVAEQLEEAA